MYEQQQHMVVGREREQCRPQRQIGRQVEAVRRRLGQIRIERGRCACHHRERLGRFGRGNDLLLRAVLAGNETRAQALVPLAHIVEGGGERRPVERPLEAHGDRNVVCRVSSFELMKEPESRLRKRCGQRRWTRLRLEWQPTAGQRAQHGCQIAEHRRLEDGAQWKLAAQPGANAGDESRRQQRVPAQVEEMISQPDAPEIEQRRRQLAEHDGFGRERSHIGRGQPGVFRRRQRRAIELAIRRQRQRVQQHV